MTQSSQSRMNALITTLLLLSSVATLGYTAGINILPEDAATQLSRCAWRAGWYAANTRKGYSADASRDRAAISDHLRNFKQNMAGIISDTIANKMKDMFVAAGWHTANTRWNYDSDARRDRTRFNNLYNDISESGEVSSSLLRDIKEMSWAAAWHCANTRVGYHSDARRDRDRFNDYSDEISGTVQLVRVTFYANRLRTLQTPAPRVIFKKCLYNTGTVPQTTPVCTSTETVQYTQTYTHTVGFQHTINAGIDINVIKDVLGFNFGMSFQFSESRSIATSLTRSITRAETWSMTVPPQSSYGGKAIVHELEADVPYDLVFDFGGTQKVVHGMWNGVLVSQANSDVRPLEYAPCPEEF